MALVNGQNVYGGTNGASSHGQNTIVHYYDKAGVKAANAINVYGQWADRRSMPLKMGKTFKVSKWLHIYDRNPSSNAEFATKGYLSSRDINDVVASNTASALPEGSGDINKVFIEKVTIDTNFARYGNMIPFTDEVDMFSEDMVQVRYREELGFYANQKQEDLIQLSMMSGANTIHSDVANSTITVGGTVLADGTTDNLAMLDYDMVRRAAKRLVRNRAPKNTSIVTGDTKIDTRTINKAYYAIIGNQVKFGLETLTRGSGNVEEYAYIPAYKYAAAANLAEGEVGAMHDMRFIESESQIQYTGAGAVAPVAYAGSLATTTLTAAQATALGAGYSTGEVRFDVFPILIPAEGSFATVGLKGQGKIKFTSKAPSDLELTNPYGTKGFFAYNFWFASLILREERLLKLMVCATN